jgi:hypothetical protein
MMGDDLEPTVSLDGLGESIDKICTLVDLIREQRRELLNLAHEAIVMVEDLDNEAARQWRRAAADTIARIEGVSCQTT